MKHIISWEVAEGMLNMAAYIVTMEVFYQTGRRPSTDFVNSAARDWFNAYCDVNGIEEVEESK